MDDLVREAVARCRGCSHPLTDVFVDLGLSPLANRLPLASSPGPDPLYPLKAWFCDQCFLVQVEEVQTPEQIFSDYPYLSSYSTTWLAHTSEYAAKSVERLGLSSESFVIELASNDGHLLRRFSEAGCRVLGVEPALNVANLANEAGVRTLAEFFGAASAGKIASAEGKADLIIANNVLAHVPDLHDFVEGMKLLLAPEGTISVEFPHLQELVRYCQFDTIYHEHFCYFSLGSVERVLVAHGLKVFDIERLATHGGSLRLWLCHRDASRPVTERVALVVAEEQEAGLRAPEAYVGFAGRVAQLRERLLGLIAVVQASGQRLVGYGAPAKASTLLNYCQVLPDVLAYTVDANPHKQGRAIPGVRVPIRAPAVLWDEGADVVFVLAWNLRREVMALLDRQLPGCRALFHQPLVELV